MKNILIAALVAATIYTPSWGQINSPLPDGFLSRGAMMLSDDNIVGATEQLGEYRRLAGHGNARADRLYARALMLSGRYVQARALMLQWLQDYPGSPERMAVKALLGESYMLEHDWANAVKALQDVESDGLTGPALTRYFYTLGYSLMMLGEYPRADAAFKAIPAWADYQYANAALFYQGYVAFAQGRYADARPMLERCNGNLPPANSRQYYLGQIYYLQEDYAKALEAARQAQNVSLPTSLKAENLRVIGECLYQQGSQAQAIEYLEQYATMAADPQPSALYILGKAQYDTGRYQSAITSLQKVAAQCDDAMGQSAYLYIGQAYVKEGDIQAALLAFNKAVEMPYDEEVQQTAFYDYAVATVEGAGVPFGSSVKVLEEFLTRYPSSSYAPKVQEYVIAGYITDNDYGAALRNIRAVKKPTPAILKAKQRVLYTLGSRSLNANKASEAEKYLQEATAISGGDRDVASEVILLLGDALYRQGRYDRAAENYLAYLQQRPEAVNAPLARYNLGYARLGQKRYDDAVIDFRRALSSGRLEDALVYDSWCRIGDARYYTSQFDAAAEAYDQALKASPQHGDYAMYQRSVMYGLARQYERQLKAIDDFGRQFPASPLIPASLLDKAVALGQMGRNDEAIEAYDVIISRYPSSPKAREAYVQMAQMLENAGAMSRAVEAYKHIVAAYPTSDEASVAVMALKRIGASDGNIGQYATYISGVKGAPAINPDEVAAIEYDTAEKEYHAKGTTGRLEAFVQRYPDHASTAEALACLAEAAADDARTLEYCDEILRRFPHSEAAVDALEMKADILLSQGRAQAAADTYRQLGERGGAEASDRAHQGLMRAYNALGQAADVIAEADALLASAALPEASRAEAVCLRGLAHNALGDKKAARDDWRSISTLTDTPHGAQAVVLLAQDHLDAKDYKNAIATAQQLVNAHTPQQYWLARAFIVLSDAKRAQGRTFEADEYLKALRQNYPGKEADIQGMITTRLKK